MFGVWTSDGSVAPSSHSGLFHCLTGKTTLTSTRSPSIMWHCAENTCRHLYIQLFWLAFEHRAALCSTKWSSVGSSPYWLNSIQHKSHSLSVANPSFPSKHRCPPLPLCHADCDVTRPKCCSHKEDNQNEIALSFKSTNRSLRVPLHNSLQSDFISASYLVFTEADDYTLSYVSRFTRLWNLQIPVV